MCLEPAEKEDEVFTSQWHGLKRNVRIPRKYENSSVVTGKKAAKVNNGSNNEVVMEAEGMGMWGKFGLKDVIVNASGINLFEFKDKEAWSMKGKSALDSSLSKPMMMDYTITRMCQRGVRRTDYARVLVEFEAKKVVKNEIKIEYIDHEKVKGTKEVKVMYDWKPKACSYCNVFGHCVEKCKSRPRTEEEIESKFKAKEKVRKDNEES
nr:hypothetical protein [Tanacetum cinerariifolium]